MNIRTKISLAFLFLLIPSVIIGYLTTVQLNKIVKPLNVDIPKVTEDLSKASKLDNLAQSILYYDEVLTQSARNYAFTKDIKWKDRYLQEVPKLDAIIKSAISLGDAQDKNSFEEIDAANLILVKMEETSLSLVDNNKQQEAIAVLESPEYQDQKDVYKEGLNKYANRRSQKYNQALTVSTETLASITKETQLLLDNGIKTTISLVVFSAIIAVFLGIFLAFFITRPIFLLEKTVLEITKGDLKERVNIESKDEVGHLADAFNKMADSLEQTKNTIEAKVAERTAQIEKTNKYLTGRELKMIELKKQLKLAVEEIALLKKTQKLK